MKGQEKQKQIAEYDREQKQVYLRNEIINKGFSPQQFIFFLNDRLDIDSDLSKCTMEQLQQIVIFFKKHKSEPSESRYSDGNEDTMICEKITIIEQNEPKLITINENPKIQQQEFFNEVKCIKSNIKHLKTNIMCEVNEPKRISSSVMGIAQKSYLSFKIASHGLTEGYVRRRYGDFIWLRTVLLKLYPTEIIPPIPNKKASKRLPRQILKRMRILEMFCNDLVRNPKLLSDRYVDGFLTEKNNNKFEKLKDEGSNKKTFESMLSNETASGFISLQLSKKTLNYKNCLTHLVPQLEITYKDITRKSKDMRRLTGDQINTLYKIGNKCADLHELTSKINSLIKTEGITKLSQIFGALNNMMIQWGNSLKRQMDEVEKNLCTFFKYVREELVGVQEILQKEKVIEDEFIRQKQIIDKQKQKIFQLHNPSKWGIPKKQIEYVPKSAIYDRNQAFKMMMPKESVKVNELKKEMAYHLARIYENGDRYFSNDAEKFCENFQQFVIKTKVNNQEIGAMWAQFSSKFSDPYKNQNVNKIENLLDSLEYSELGESVEFQ